MKLRCRLLGCSLADAAPCCERCGAYLYGHEMIEWEQARLYPLLDPLYRWYYAVRGWVWPRCGVCRRRLWPWRGKSCRYYSADFCSPACEERFVPF